MPLFYSAQVKGRGGSLVYQEEEDRPGQDD